MRAEFAAGRSLFLLRVNPKATQRGPVRGPVAAARAVPW